MCVRVYNHVLLCMFRSAYADMLHDTERVTTIIQGGPKKVSLIIFVITLSTASQFS